MQIDPPFGYKAIAPLNRKQKVRLLKPGEIPEFARTLNAIPISYTEFGPVSRDYPIVFTSGDKAASYAPMAVLGLASGENLFYGSGGWATGFYIPAYARRFPFCMARVKMNEVEQQNRLICVEKAHLDDKDGEALFGDQGESSPKWKDIERLLTEYEVDLERSRELCSILLDYGLLEPFAAQAKFATGGAAQLTGMHRVAEAKIEQLNASQIKNLARKGVLGRIYAHLLSLENFARLLDRKAAQIA